MLRNPAFKASAAGNLPRTGHRPELSVHHLCLQKCPPFRHTSYHIIHTDNDSVQCKHKRVSPGAACLQGVRAIRVSCFTSRPVRRCHSHFLAVKTNSLARESLPMSFGSRCNVPRSAQSPMSTWSVNTRQAQGKLVCVVLVLTRVFHSKRQREFRDTEEV